MGLWMVRAGRDGENEDLGIEQGIVSVDFRQVGDLAETTMRRQLEDLTRVAYPDESDGAYQLSW